MSSGTMGDPQKCRRSLGVLARTLAGTGVLVGGRKMFGMLAEHNAQQGQFPEERLVKGMQGVFTVIAAGVITYTYAREASQLWPHQFIQRLWQDCGGGGWLKTHLDAAKAKLQAGVEKVKSLAPQPKPNPIPVASYTMNAEASYRRAASATSMTKGMAIIGAATVVGAISAALYVFVFRDVPMIDAAPAGFGFTTGDSPLSSDQNNFL